jgi:signal-transduction protein with cAMP-binding, CBS, and nucleotidyltransferase domain
MKPARLPAPVTGPPGRRTIEPPGHRCRFLTLAESWFEAQLVRKGGSMSGRSVGSIVSEKQIQELITVPATAMVSEAVSKMTQKGVGAILIRNAQNTIDGIFTERDLMVRVVNMGRDPKTTAIGTVMSLQLRRVKAATSVEEASRLMVVQRYRHLVVEDGGNIQGIVSIRDLMASMVAPGEPIAHAGRP